MRQATTDNPPPGRSLRGQVYSSKAGCGLAKAGELFHRVGFQELEPGYGYGP
jgi:hypothetical protein